MGQRVGITGSSARLYEAWPTGRSLDTGYETPSNMYICIGYERIAETEDKNG